MLRDELIKEISSAVGAEVDIKLVEPERAENGDFSTNVAFKLAPSADGAEGIADKLRKSELIKEVVVKNKFINIFIKDEAIISALDKKINPPKFSDRKLGRVNVEFVSANPTGPLTMANGRGGFYGDVLSNVLKKVGYEVTREYYINDAGNQVRLLGESIQAAEGKIPNQENYYKGEYVKELVGKTGVGAVSILLNQIKKSLASSGIEFDVWFSEKELREKKEPEKVLKLLEEKKLIEKKDGAVWLGPPAGGAVLVKSDGEYTYFLVDLAYHWNKFFERQFDLGINIWGPDHHGYVKRIKEGLAAIGVDPEKLKILITQTVRAISQGKEVKMSKRSGQFVTMDDLLEDFGVDVTRWFFLERALSTHMDFDLDLAKEKSEKNPVYYVQYAHARMAGILNKSNAKPGKLVAFGNPAERSLALKILRLQGLLEDISKDYQVHLLTTYAYELAQTFSAFYRDVKVIGSGREAELLYLVSKTKETLADVLKLLGVSQPEKM